VQLGLAVHVRASVQTPVWQDSSDLLGRSLEWVTTVSLINMMVEIKLINVVLCLTWDFRPSHGENGGVGNASYVWLPFQPDTEDPTKCVTYIYLPSMLRCAVLCCHAHRRHSAAEASGGCCLIARLRLCRFKMPGLASGQGNGQWKISDYL
jgi:hypothetical protein